MPTIYLEASSINAIIYVRSFFPSILRYGPTLESPHQTSLICFLSYLRISLFLVGVSSFLSRLTTLLTVDRDISFDLMVPLSFSF